MTPVKGRIASAFAVGSTLLVQSACSASPQEETTMPGEAIQGSSEIVRIRVVSGGDTAVFELNGSRASASLLAQLPLTVKLEDYGSNEKIFYPPARLDAKDTPLARTGQAGTLAYYAPWGDVVLFFGSFSAATGLHELGNAVAGQEVIRTMSGTVTITKVSR